MRLFMLFAFCFLLLGCAPRACKQPPQEIKVGDNVSRKNNSYILTYYMPLIIVERSENARARYGAQRIDTQSVNEKYNSHFEDDFVSIYWLVDGQKINFFLENKTDHSIRIPWDKAVFVDKHGMSYRIIHSGIKYDDLVKPQAPSIVVRKGSIEDGVFPIDSIYFQYTTRTPPAKCAAIPSFPSYISVCSKSINLATLKYMVKKTMKRYIGTTCQVMLPFQIDGEINDYLFTFRVDSVTTTGQIRTK